MDEKKNILVVEDDPVSTKLVTSCLQSAGYTVQIAPHGRQALQEIQKNPPDLIISDVCMPEMDGFTLFKELKKDKSTANIPVIILSAHSKMEDTFEVVGADAFISKPFDTKEFLLRVESIISRRSKTVDPVAEPQKQEQEIKKKKPVQTGPIGIWILVAVIMIGCFWLASYMMKASKTKKVLNVYLLKEELP